MKAEELQSTEAKSIFEPFILADVATRLNKSVEEVINLTNNIPIAELRKIRREHKQRLFGVFVSLSRQLEISLQNQ